MRLIYAISLMILASCGSSNSVQRVPVTVYDTTHKVVSITDTSYSHIIKRDTVRKTYTVTDTILKTVTLTDTVHKTYTIIDTVHKTYTIIDTNRKTTTITDTTRTQFNIIDTVHKTITIRDTVVIFDTVHGTNFGLDINSQTLSPAQKAVIERDSFHVTHIRGGTVINSFTGVDKSFEIYTSYGLKTVWNINFTQQLNGIRDRTIDTTLFKNGISLFFRKYKPEVVVNENEIDNNLYYFGSVNGYLAELRILVDSAHKYGVKVADAGLHDDYLCWYVAKDYQARKLTDSLNWWMSLTFNPMMKASWNGTKTSFSNHISFYDTLLSEMRNISIDYWNIHVYQDSIPPNITLIYLQTINNWGNRYFGKPMISNEFGLKNKSNPDAVTSMMMSFIILKIPYGIYFSGSGNDKAQSLLNPDGTVNSNGIAFRQIIKT